jgi:hypothetical protein
MTGAVGALDSHLAQWLDAEPEARLAQIYVHAARDPRVAALEAIAHELHASLFAVRDAGVAQAKLAWWLDELAQRPRHPLTRGLVDAAGSQAPMAPLREACASLLRLAHADSIESLDQLLQPLVAAAVALGRAREDEAGIDPQAVAAARLVFAARDWVCFARPDRAWLPLDLLARTGVDRTGAVASVPVARALLCALGEPLARVRPGRLRGIDGARVAAARVWHARMLAAPATMLEGRLPPPRLRLVLALWRVGRRR